VQTRLEPAYNPRRPAQKAALDLEHEALTDPTVWLCSACDLCFAGCRKRFIFQRCCSPSAGWPLPRSHKFRPAGPGQRPDLRACGCAWPLVLSGIQLAEVKVMGRDKRIARVDSNSAWLAGCAAPFAARPPSRSRKTAPISADDELRDRPAGGEE